MTSALQLKSLYEATKVVTMEEHQVALEELFNQVDSGIDKYTIETNKLSLMMQYTKEGLELPDDVIACRIACESIFDSVVNAIKKIVSYVIGLVSKLINKLTGGSSNTNTKPVTRLWLSPEQLVKANELINSDVAIEDSESTGVTTRLQSIWMKYNSIRNLLDNVSIVISKTSHYNLEVTYSNGTYKVKANTKSDVQHTTNGIQLLDSTKCLRTHLEQLILECNLVYQFVAIRSLKWNPNEGYSCNISVVEAAANKTGDNRLDITRTNKSEPIVVIGEIEKPEFTIKALNNLNYDITKPDTETPTRNQLKLINNELKAVFTAVDTKLKNADIDNPSEATKLNDFKVLLMQISYEIVSCAFTLETINSIDTDIRSCSRVIMKSISEVVSI